MAIPTHIRRIGLLPLLLAQLLMLGSLSAQDQVPSAAPDQVPAAAAGTGPQKAPGSVRLFPAIVSADDPSQADDAATYAASLRSGLDQSLKAAGYQVAMADAALTPDLSEPAQAADLAHTAGNDWAAVCALSLSEGRLSYRVAIYDSADGSLAAGDSFSVLSGLGALRTMGDSAAAAVGRLGDYRAGHAGTVRTAVSYRIAVSCPSEGATVRIESPGLKSGAPTGKIKNGKVLLPYFPFLQGSTLVVSATTKLLQRMSTTVTLETQAPLIELMPRKPRFDILVGTGTGRLLGAGAELRAYIEPDWSFLFLEDRLYSGFDFLPGSSPVIHEESWNGLGWYLFFPPESRFRMGFSLGVGFLFSLTTAASPSKQLFFDFALLPVNLFGEYSLGKDMAAWMSLRSAFSVGTEGSGLLARGWMGNGTPAISLGWLWRRK